MNRIVFLDRDGVVNVERGDYTWLINDFKLTSGLVPFLKEIQERGYLVIIISNQGGVGKGLYTVAEVEKVHGYLRDQLASEGVEISDIYYCPHHPSKGRCLCRKPESVMLEKAIARYHADVKQSYFVGDSYRDIDAGRRVNLNTILVTANDDLQDYLQYIK